KLRFKVSHVEAGLRSFDMNMPEEVNRVLTDRISDILFCPTDTAIENLKREGRDHSNCRIVKSGDVMKDIALFSSPHAKSPDFPVPEDFILVTMHRAGNTDDPRKLASIIRALNRISYEIDIIFPIHPRTRKILSENGIKTEFDCVEPVGYLQMLYLLKNCRCVLTDSGGLQKEAFLFQKLSVILREKTEWVELVEHGFAILTGSDEEKIYKGYKMMVKKPLDFNGNFYGARKASEIIAKELSHDLYIVSSV
ncbi:MAG: UDP-N-acetyl glucosamine 2-epimerase, partial [Candidatus Omnitrophica bacterium]|nr:UDP-N-acetyl glucosamine 2-epimerase [Candidatus Omnitrophota bacterium]